MLMTPKASASAFMTEASSWTSASTASAPKSFGHKTATRDRVTHGGPHPEASIEQMLDHPAPEKAGPAEHCYNLPRPLAPSPDPASAAVIGAVPSGGANLR